ncbi:hypothetical protein NCPPB3778_33 [Rathayibacter phage NCPPB3778]|nr:hypothetical protein NCPPB3778_33 [Rathayibacter phage NCPPB3778]
MSIYNDFEDIADAVLRLIPKVREDSDRAADQLLDAYAYIAKAKASHQYSISHLLGVNND